MGEQKKIKTYYAQINLDSRHIRQIAGDKQALREEAARLQAQLAERDMPERAALRTALDAANADMAAAQAKAKEATARSELLERTLSHDNRTLRGRVHALERELAGRGDRIGELEEALRERDKQIASLAIYRFNAMKRQGGGGAEGGAASGSAAAAAGAKGGCKVCRKRERDEREAARRASILGGSLLSDLLCFESCCLTLLL
jgi:hypothetical protein